MGSLKKSAIRSSLLEPRSAPFKILSNPCTDMDTFSQKDFFVYLLSIISCSILLGINIQVLFVNIVKHI